MSDRMTGAPGAENTRTVPALRPVADIYETKEALVAILELPGVGPDGLNVTLDKRVLTVSGRTQASVPAGAVLTVGEYRVGDFERSFTLAETINTDQIEAALKDGLLRLTLPKSLPAPAKTIKVRAG